MSDAPDHDEITGTRFPERRKTDRWRTEIRREIEDLKRDITQLKKNHSDSQSELKVNTDICAATKITVDKVLERQAPMLDTWDKIEPGIRVLGAIAVFGRLCFRFAEWLVDHIKPVTVICIALIVVMKGGSWSEAWKMVTRMFARE